MLYEPEKPIHILLVEDNPGDVFIIKRLLRNISFSYTLQHAVDGEEAIKYLQQVEQYITAPCPDFILLDLNIPKVNGHQVLSQIKGDLKLKLIPVVVLTGSMNPNDLDSNNNDALTCYLPKPSGRQSQGETIQAIEDFLERCMSMRPGG